MSQRKNKNQSIILIVLASMLLSLPMGHATTVVFPADTVFGFVEIRPAFPRGVSAMYQYINENIVFPETLDDETPIARIFTQFVVSRSGEIDDVKILRSNMPTLNEEVVRVIASMPAWIPAKHQGEIVSAEFSLPITLTINSAPQFSGGEKALQQFLLDNIVYTYKSDKNGIPRGRLIAEFNVSENGEVKGAKITSGITELIDAEVIRVIELMPDWTPGIRNGKNAEIAYILPINFHPTLLNPMSNPNPNLNPNPTSHQSESDFVFATVEPEDFVIPIYEIAPEFPGGLHGMYQYLHDNMRYPEDALKVGAQARVVLSFVVEKDGSITDIQIDRAQSRYRPQQIPRTIPNSTVIGGIPLSGLTYSHLFDNEAIRIVGGMPRWIPGEQGGRKVRVRFTLPIEFRLTQF